MEDWARNRLVLEIALTVGGALALALGARPLYRFWVNRSPGKWMWVPWVALALSLPLLRRLLLDMDWVEEPVARLQEGVESFPESLEDLDAVNDWIYDVIVPLGVPGGFLLGYLVKTATVATGKLLVRVPLALLGAGALGIAYQYTVLEAEGFGEAVGGLWETLGQWF